MADDQSRQCVLAFLDGFYAGDVTGVEKCCDDNFESLTYAPVELFPHLGHKRGKAWIAEAIQIQKQRYSSRRYALKSIIVQGSRVAAILEASLTKRSDQRIVQFTVAEFFSLRAGLIVEHRSFLDSFDLVQQLLGHDLTDAFATSVSAAMRQ